MLAFSSPSLSHRPLPSSSSLSPRSVHSLLSRPSEPYWPISIHSPSPPSHPTLYCSATGTEFEILDSQSEGDFQPGQVRWGGKDEGGGLGLGGGREGGKGSSDDLAIGGTNHGKARSAAHKDIQLVMGRRTEERASVGEAACWTAVS